MRWQPGMWRSTGVYPAFKHSHHGLAGQREIREENVQEDRLRRYTEPCGVGGARELHSVAIEGNNALAPRPRPARDPESHD